MTYHQWLLIGRQRHQRPDPGTHARHHRTLDHRHIHILPPLEHLLLSRQLQRRHLALYRQRYHLSQWQKKLDSDRLGTLDLHQPGHLLSLRLQQPMAPPQTGRHLDLYFPGPAPQSLRSLLDHLCPELPERSLLQFLERFSSSLLRHRRPIVINCTNLSLESLRRLL